MTYEFRPAVREQTSLLLAFAGPSGSGKTLSALKVARGLSGGDDAKIAVIDTEAGRALHYAPAPGEKADDKRFSFRHCDMKAPFTPMAYIEAILAAEKSGATAIVVDSASHEWAGEGGCQDMHDEILDRQAGKEEWKREKLNASAWRDPKREHKRMVARLLQCRAHLIFCLRAEEKIKFVKVKDDQGREKTAIVAAGWQPICEKGFMFEMTASFMLPPDRPGIGQPIKLQDQHRAAFPEGALIGEAAGEALAAWARGGAMKQMASFRLVRSDNKVLTFKTAGEWTNVIAGAVAKMVDEGAIDAFISRNNAAFAEARGIDPDAAMATLGRIEDRRKELSQGAAA